MQLLNTFDQIAIKFLDDVDSWIMQTKNMQYAYKENIIK